MHKYWVKIMKVWNEILVKICLRPIKSMLKRVQAVNWAKKGHKVYLLHRYGQNNRG